MLRRYPWTADIVIPPLVAAVIVSAGSAHHGGTRAVPLVLGCAAGLSLIARRWAPITTLALTGALAVALQHVAPAANPAAVLAPAVALYSLALSRGARTRVIAAAAAVAAVVVVEIVLAQSATLPQILGHVLLVAIPVLIADVHRTRHAHVALLRERLELAERTREQEAERRAEWERMRIARDLHDVIGHTLTTINVQASTARELMNRDPDHARDALATIENASRNAIDEVRGIFGVLRTGETTDAPLKPAPGLDDVPELIEQARRTGTDVTVEVAGDRPEAVPEGVSLALYRIVQEALTNARRHAAGAPVRLALSFHRDRLGLMIENRPGDSSGSNGNNRGVGIMGMTERAKAVGGTVNVTEAAGVFRVDADLPFLQP